MNAAEIIKKDLDAIYIGNLSTVDDNLTLPENGQNHKRDYKVRYV